MKLNCSFLALVPFLSVTTFAANKVGNGGNVVFCESETKQEIVLLDFYESKLDFQSSESDPKVIVEKKLIEFKAIAPRLADLYLKRLKEIFNEIDFKSEITLIDLKDSFHLFKPHSALCEILQIAIRNSNAMGNEKTFIFRLDLWNKLSPLNQAGLITHEIIYEHLGKLDESDSIKVRKINSFLYQSRLNGNQFWQLIKDLSLPIYP